MFYKQLLWIFLLLFQSTIYTSTDMAQEFITSAQQAITNDIHKKNPVDFVVPVFEKYALQIPKDIHDLFLASQAVNLGQDLQAGDFIFLSYPRTRNIKMIELFVVIDQDNLLRAIKISDSFVFDLVSVKNLFGVSLRHLSHSSYCGQGPFLGAFMFFGSYRSYDKINALAEKKLPEQFVLDEHNSYVFQENQATLSSDDLAMVDLTRVNSSIAVSIRAATEYNLAGYVLYDGNRCFVRNRMAERLDSVQKALAQKGLGLKVIEGYRPLHVQKIMWDMCPVTNIVGDHGLIGNPYAKGSNHNRGAAVDVTLVNLDHGQELDMGCPVHELTERAFLFYSLSLTQEQIGNRKILHDAMVTQGFIHNPCEWWHFNDHDCKAYPILDLKLSEL